MTYPQHIDPRYAQQYAPQQYPTPPTYPTPPQYGGAPAPQQYGGAPAPQQPAPVSAPVQGGQSLPTSAPALGQTKGAGGAASPKARHLLGRTIIIEPIRVDETAKDNKGAVRPEAYFHLTVCDGGPLEYGDNLSDDPAERRPNTHRIETPCRFTSINDYGYGFVNEVRDAIARGDMAAVGVFERGTQGNKPYLLTKPGRGLDGNDRPDGDARFALAAQLWQSVFDKTFRSPEPVNLVVPPAQPAPQVAYQPAAPAGYASQQYAQTGTVPTPYGAAPAQQLHPEYVAAATQPGYAPQQYAYPPVNTGGTAGMPLQQPGYAPQQYMGQPMQHDTFPAMQPQAVVQQQYQPQPQTYAGPGVSMLQAAVQQSAPPVNPAFEAWLATLPPEAQAQQRAAYASTQQGNGHPTGPGL